MIRRRRLAWVLPAVIALVTVAAFLPALGAGFVSWDDERNFVTNPHFRGLGLAQLKWMWSTTLLGHYVPITWMTLGADYALWGMNPAGYHLTNILVHTANAILVFSLARSVLSRGMGEGRDPVQIDLAAAFAALLFAAHPLRAESVAWVTERRDVVSGFFCLLSVIWYLRAVESGQRRVGMYAGSLAAYVCALLSKGNSVVVPAVLLVLNLYPLRRLGGPAGWISASGRRVFAELLPFAVPAAGFVVLSIAALKPPEQLPLGGKIAVSSYSLGFYLLKTVIPAKLCALYAMPITVNPADSRWIAGYFAVVVYVAAVVLSWKKRPGLTAGLLAFGVISLPLLGIVQNGPQIAADRYTYHSAPALALLGGAGFLIVAARWSSRLAMTFATAIVLVLAALTARQAGFWKNSQALWARVLSIEPESGLANSAWAALLYQQNRVDEAIAHSVRAIRGAPGLAEGHNDLGVGLARKGDFDGAVKAYKVSLSLKPVFDEAENNWGVVLAARGLLDSATMRYQRALAANPDNPDAEVNLGNILVRQGRSADAIEHYRRALWIRPDHADAHLNWGVALARDGRLAEAVDHFEAALAINASHAEARNYLTQAQQILRQQSGQVRPPSR